MIKYLIGNTFLLYLRFFARLQLKKNPSAVVIGITGSSGKTSTRLALYKILSKRGRVKHSVHANSESGLPLNILGINLPNYSISSWIKVLFLAPYRYLTYTEQYDYYIVEMGIDSPDFPKNMDYLLSIIKPDIAIILGVSLVHSGAFDHLYKDTSLLTRRKKILSRIKDEKMKLARAIGSKGVVVINSDDTQLMKDISALKARTILVGSDKNADYQIVSTNINKAGFKSSFKHLGNKYDIKLRDIFSSDYARTFVVAIAIGHTLGLSIDNAIESLGTYRAPAGRLRVIAGKKNTHIIDSSYNASPTSMDSALQTLKQIAKNQHKLAILGDMNELGTTSKYAHQNLAKKITLYSDEVILFGDQMKKYVLPQLIRLKFPVYHATNMNDLINHLNSVLIPKSWILVKGSQNKIFLERAVKAILANPKDSILLARQSKYWDGIKAKTL